MMSVPEELQRTIKKVFSKNGCSHASINNPVFDEILSEGDVNYVAQSMQDWQTFLPTLDLSFQDGRDINEDITLSSPMQKR